MKVANKVWEQGLSYEFDEHDLKLESLTTEPNTFYGTDLRLLLEGILHDDDAFHRTFGMALALFFKLKHDNSIDGLEENDIFAKALHTAIIWEVG